MDLTLRSPAFEAGGAIPVKYTCDGENVSPPLEWQGMPDGTETLVLIFDDPDASTGPGGPFAHWVIYNIPNDTWRLYENYDPERLEGAAQGKNSFGNTWYEGPCPPREERHQYYFRLYALDTRLDIPAGPTREQIIDFMKGHILEHTEMMAHFSREEAFDIGLPGPA